jgi:hypothetical protein
LPALYHMFFKFLGQVLGLSIRNRVTFPLRLCSLVWKPLVGQALTPSDLFDTDEDLKSMLRQIRTDVAPYGDEMMEDADVRWVTHLSDGREVNLLPLRPRPSKDTGRSGGGGSDGDDDGDANGDDDDDDDDDDLPEDVVRASEVDAYIEAVINVRLNECRAAALAMREGLCSIVPAAAVSLLHWKELRALVAGRDYINIELLRSCTEYDEDVSPGAFPLSVLAFLECRWLAAHGKRLRVLAAWFC